MFGSVKLTKNHDPDKYKYSGYGIRFHLRSEFSLPDGSMDKNLVIFGVDMSSSVLNDDKKKDTLILGKARTQRLDNAMLTAEPQYSINFSRSNRKFCLSLHYNGATDFYLLMLQKYTNSKQMIPK